MTCLYSHLGFSASRRLEEFWDIYDYPIVSLSRANARREGSVVEDPGGVWGGAPRSL
jgi:hypothetical protein